MSYPPDAITTNQTKAAQETMFFLGDSVRASNVVLVVGSCRAVPYLNYMQAYNRAAGKPVFAAAYVNPADLQTTATGYPQDAREAIMRLVSRDRVKDFCSEATAMLCEHVQNYGALNTTPDGWLRQVALPIYSPVFTIPNWNAMAVLQHDILELFPLTFQGRLLRHEHEKVSKNSIQKFFDHCVKSSFPEMAEVFEASWRKEKWFHTHNHVARPFTEFIFTQWLMRMGIDPMPREALEWTRSFDLFAKPCTEVTQQDREVLEIEWS
jgi:hypothetical protein